MGRLNWWPADWWPTDTGSWQITITHHCLSICDMSEIKRSPPQLYEFLWHQYFRMSNVDRLFSPVYLCCLPVVTTRHNPSPLLTPIMDPMYWICMSKRPPPLDNCLCLIFWVVPYTRFNCTITIKKFNGIISFCKNILILWVLFFCI